MSLLGFFFPLLTPLNQALLSVWLWHLKMHMEEGLFIAESCTALNSNLATNTGTCAIVLVIQCRLS